MEKKDLLEFKDKLKLYAEHKGLDPNERYWLFKMLYNESETDMDDYFYGGGEEVNDIEQEIDSMNYQGGNVAVQQQPMQSQPLPQNYPQQQQQYQQPVQQPQPQQIIQPTQPTPQQTLVQSNAPIVNEVKPTISEDDIPLDLPSPPKIIGYRPVQNGKK